MGEDFEKRAWAMLTESLREVRAKIESMWREFHDINHNLTNLKHVCEALKERIVDLEKDTTVTSDGEVRKVNTYVSRIEKTLEEIEKETKRNRFYVFLLSGFIFTVSVVVFGADKVIGITLKLIKIFI